MRVVLRSEVLGVGKRGDILDVADGFARNYLIPRGDAMKANTGTDAQAASMRRVRELRDAREREGAENLAAELAPTVIRVRARAGREGRLFGSVTPADVSEAIADQTGVQVDRRRIELADPIRSLGVHEVPLRLHPEVELRLTVEVASGS